MAIQNSKDTPKDGSACGIGAFSAPTRSHSFLSEILDHTAIDRARGSGVSGYGDGAGISMTLDHDFFRHRLNIEQRVNLPERFGIISAFTTDSAPIATNIASVLGLNVLAVRTAPTDPSRYHVKGRSHLPLVQFFVTGDDLENALAQAEANPA
ncbi:hypothetical protein EBR96_07525, partial [bacterium]|nr:hypothetical protein [bacterium]